MATQIRKPARKATKRSARAAPRLTICATPEICRAQEICRTRET